MGVLGLLPLGPCFVVGGLSGKSGALIIKKIMYLCFATFLRTTYTTDYLCLHTLSAWVAGQGMVS